MFKTKAIPLISVFGIYLFVPLVVCAQGVGIDFKKNLQRGMRGNDVKILQEFLKQSPEIYPQGLVTGYYGRLTEAAVKKLQESQGIEAVGIVGPKTKARLNELIVETGFSIGGGGHAISAIPATPVASDVNKNLITLIIPTKPAIPEITTTPTTSALQFGQSTSTPVDNNLNLSTTTFFGVVSTTPASSTPSGTMLVIPTTSQTPASTPSQTPASTPSQTPAPTPSPQTTTSTNTTALSTPTNLSAVGASPSQINLSWSNYTNSVGVVGYKVYRNGAQIATTVSSSTSATTIYYTDTGLQASTVYSYNVAAYDIDGNIGNQSNQASATTLAQPTADTTPPSTPTDFSVLFDPSGLSPN